MSIVQKHLGHSTYSTTEKYYGHLDQTAKRQSVEALSRAGLAINFSKDKEPEEEDDMNNKKANK